MTTFLNKTTPRRGFNHNDAYELPQLEKAASLSGVEGGEVAAEKVVDEEF